MIDVPVSYAAIIDEVTECGILKSDFIVEYSDSYQSELLLIRTAKNLLPGDIYSCIWELEKKYGLIVIFEDDEAQASSWNYKKPILKKQERGTATKNLVDAGLFDYIPQYEPEKETLIDFVHRVEEFSSVEPNTLLMVYKEDMITIKFDRINMDNFDKLSKAMSIAIDALTLSNIEDHGVTFGIIGNEQIHEDKDSK